MKDLKKGARYIEMEIEAMARDAIYRAKNGLMNTHIIGPGKEVKDVQTIKVKDLYGCDAPAASHRFTCGNVGPHHQCGTMKEGESVTIHPKSEAHIEAEQRAEALAHILNEPPAALRALQKMIQRKLSKLDR